jgi:hypothetical protein
MTWRFALATTAVALALAACSQSPTSPATLSGPGSSVGSGGGGVVGLAGRGNPQPPVGFNFAFFDHAPATPHPNDNQAEPVGSDLIGGSAQLAGTIKGSVGSRTFALAGGAIDLVITNVRQGHGQADNCGPGIQALLETKGLVGSPLYGTSTNLEIDESGSGFSLTIDGIAGNDGQAWRVVLFSTSGSHAQLSEDSSGAITVIQDYGEVGFRVPAQRGNKWGESYGCKLYFAFTLVPAA